MTNIEITQEQKDKLLEMCRKLFPEHKWSFTNDLEEEGMLDCDIHCNRPKFKLFHWFEFCIEHLSKKVFTINNEVMSGYAYFINNIRYTKQHPIDYLYEQFKLLK